MANELPHVVIVGGGFGGLEVAKGLKGAPVKVTLIDRTNHHLFQPLLYQVATAAISSVEIAYPIRSIFRNQNNTTVLMADVKSIDLKQRRVCMAGHELSYDYLVIAAGSENSYFGHNDWAKHSLALKTLRDAFKIRRQVLLAFELAEKQAPEERHPGLLNFVIVGGGPTGVELAGSLSELSRHVLSRDFRNVNPKSARIIILEGADHQNVFAIGDIVVFMQDGKPLPGVAPVAIQQGQSAAKSIKNRVVGRETKEFHYVDRGLLATIGRSAAVGNFGDKAFNGPAAWFVWLVIHVLNLIGFRNRIVVVFDWLWSYITYQRGARLIVYEEGQNLDKAPEKIQTESKQELKK